MILISFISLEKKLTTEPLKQSGNLLREEKTLMVLSGQEPYSMYTLPLS